MSAREPEAGELTSLRERLETFLGAGPRREVSENGEFLFELAPGGFRLEEAGGRLLLHLWSAERSWTRRVVGVEKESAGRLVLAVERFGRSRPAKLEIATAAARRGGADRERTAARRAYSGWLRRLLSREFPASRLEGVSTAADLKRSFSALYTRARLREGQRWWAALGMNAGESAAAADAALTFGLLWLDGNRQRYPDRAWAGLRLFLPAGRTQTTASRLACLAHDRGRVELYATDEDEFRAARVDERDLGNLDTHLVPARLAEDIRAAESSAVERLRALAPGEIEELVSAGRAELSLRWRGLEFARAAGGQVSFGVSEPKLLTRDNFEQLGALVEQLRRERAPEGSAKSPLYRAQPERWLESLVQAAPQRVDPRLAPERLYRQVPALAGGERGVADLLGATRDGQLVVVELKASADLNLLCQGLDYWLRVRWHQERGELGRFGYFPGLALKAAPPELLLVAPALQFHPAIEALVEYLAPEVRVTLIGLNEDWRRGLKVVFRRARR